MAWGTGRSYRLAYRLQNSRFESTPQPNVTLDSLFHLPSEPCLVRLIYANDQDTSWRIDAASIASVAAPTVSGGEDKAAVRWQTVTFGHQGRDSDPTDAVESAAGALDLPANRRQPGQPVMLLSDWVPVQAAVRSDGGQGFLLRVRTYAHGHIRYSGSVGIADPILSQCSGGFWIDGDATNGRMDSERRVSDRIFACHGIQYVSATPGATIVGIGDSIMHSSCTTGELSGFGIRAAVRLSRPDCPVSYVSEGYPGRNSLGFLTCGRWDIEHLRPQAALIQTFSQNEPWTGEAADIAFARALELADFATRRGCVPILTTPAPTCEREGEAEVHRRRTVDRVRSLKQTGAAVLDLDAIWGTGDTPNRYRADCGCGDTWHPSNAGCAKAADHLVPMLQLLLDLA